MPLTLRGAVVMSDDGEGRRLLDGVDLTLAEGTITLVIGPRGAGKTTLLQALSGVRVLASGEVLLDGKPLWIGRRCNRELLLRLGLTFQYPERQLFARHIRGEFAYSLRPYGLPAAERARRTRDTLRAFAPSLREETERFPLTLSGGERRRVALASAFAAEPDWLLMDEPTAGLEGEAVRELLLTLQAYVAADGRRGVVIATHDLDAFLPIADRVVAVAEGRVRDDATPAELCREPRRFRRAGAGTPSCTELARAFAACGAAFPPDAMTPEDAAEAIERMLADREEWRVTGREALAAPEIPGDNRGEGECDSGGSRSPVALEEDEKAPIAWWQRFDPRAKWLVYMLGIAAVMLQGDWIGLGCAAAAVAAGFAGLPKTVIFRMGKWIRPFLLFALFSIALAGIRLSVREGLPHAGFSASDGLSTGFYVARLFVLLAISAWFASAVSNRSMTLGLQWALGFGRRLRLPVEALALAVSLMFRFLPMIAREWQRFSVIVRARGKQPLKPGQIRFRDVPALVVPLLLSLFERAEAMAMAMELKKLAIPTRAKAGSGLRWTGRDTALVAAGALLYGAIGWWRP